MTKFDELFDVVLESSAVEDYAFSNEMRKKIKSLKYDIKTAKKSKDIDKMKQISDDIDKLIDELDHYRKHEVSYDNYASIDGTIKTFKTIAAVCSALAVAIPMGILFKNTVDGFKALREGTLADEEDLRNLKTIEGKDPFKNKAALVATATSMITVNAATKLSESDRRKIIGSFDNIMDKLAKSIDKLKKLNASLKKDLEKAEKSVKESVSEIRLDIFESCHNGEITEEERDTLLKLI